MTEDEKQEKIIEFYAKLKKVIDYLDQTPGHCIICEKVTNRHVAIMASKNGADLGFGAPEIGFRYGIACICEEHDLDENIQEEVQIALEIKQITDRFKYIKNPEDLIS